MAIALRKPYEIEKLRAANVIVGGALHLLETHTKPWEGYEQDNSCPVDQE